MRMTEEPPRPQPVDYESLAEYLAALAYPVRLALLDVLRLPHALAEIRVAAQRIEPGGSPDRMAAKQTVAAHLEKLVAAGLVQVRESNQRGRSVPLYAVNPQRLYAVTEELRRVLIQHAGTGVGEDHTGTVAHMSLPKPASGPRLVLVHGVYDGKSFALDASAPRAWVVGRSAQAAVSLDYDPYVSLEHCTVEHEAGVWRLRDNPGSKNGTSLNWQRLPRGATATLRRGDLITIGRSRLLFLDA